MTAVTQYALIYDVEDRTALHFVGRPPNVMEIFKAVCPSSELDKHSLQATHMHSSLKLRAYCHNDLRILPQP